MTVDDAARVAFAFAPSYTSTSFESWNQPARSTSTVSFGTSWPPYGGVWPASFVASQSHALTHRRQ